MITGRKLDATGGGPEIVLLHGPGSSEVPIGGRVSLPKGTRQSTSKSIATAEHARVPVSPPNRIIASRPTTKDSSKAVQSNASSSNVTRSTSAPEPSKTASNAAKVVPADKGKTFADRNIRAAQWLKEEKAKTSSTKTTLQQNRLKVQQMEEFINNRRQLEEQQRVQRDLKMLMTKSFEDLFADDALPLPAPPAPMPAPVKPNVSVPTSAGAPALKPARTTTSKKHVPSPGVPIVRRSKRHAGGDADSCSDDDFRLADTKTSKIEGNDDEDYANEEFDGQAAELDLEKVPDDESDDDEHSVHQNKLVERELEEKKKRLHEGKLYVLQQRKKWKEETESEKRKQEKEKRDRLEKLAKINEESRRRIKRKPVESSKTLPSAGANRGSQNMDNIPVYDNDELDWVIVGDEQVGLTFKHKSNVSMSSSGTAPPTVTVRSVGEEPSLSNSHQISNGSASHAERLRDLHERIRQGLPGSQTNGSDQVNGEGYFRRPARFDVSNNDHLAYIPPNFPTIGSDQPSNSSLAIGSGVEGKKPAHASRGPRLPPSHSPPAPVVNGFAGNDRPISRGKIITGSVEGSVNSSVRAVGSVAHSASSTLTSIKPSLEQRRPFGSRPPVERPRSTSAPRSSGASNTPSESTRRAVSSGRAGIPRQRPSTLEFSEPIVPSASAKRRSRRASPTPTSTRLADRRRSQSQPQSSPQPSAFQSASDSSMTKKVIESVRSESSGAGRSSSNGHLGYTTTTHGTLSSDEVLRMVSQNADHLQQLMSNVQQSLRESVSSVVDLLPAREFPEEVPTYRVDRGAKSQPRRWEGAESKDNFGSERELEDDDAVSDHVIPYFQKVNDISEQLPIQYDKSATEADSDQVCLDDNSNASDQEDNVDDASSTDGVLVGSRTGSNPSSPSRSPAPYCSADVRVDNISNRNSFDLPYGANNLTMDPVAFHKMEFAKEKKRIMEMFNQVGTDPDEAKAIEINIPQPKLRHIETVEVNLPTPLINHEALPTSTSLRNVGILGGMLKHPHIPTTQFEFKSAPLTESLYDTIRREYSGGQSDSDSDSDSTNSLSGDERDHRIISIVANELYRKQRIVVTEELQAAEEAKNRELVESASKANDIRKRDALLQALDDEDRKEMDHLISNRQVPPHPDAEDTVFGGKISPQSVPSAPAQIVETEEQLDASRSFWDSMLTRPLEGVTNSIELGEDRFQRIIPRHLQSSGIAAINSESESHGGSSRGNDEMRAAKLLSAAELRIKMLDELHRQEDMFKYAFELSELEQQHTINSASQLVQMLVHNADKEVSDIRRQQEMISQQQAYELNLASTSAAAHLALQQQKLEQEKQLLELQAQLKIESMHSYFLSLRKDADQMADTLAHSAQIMDVERMVQERALREAANNVAAQEVLIQQQQYLLEQQHLEKQRILEQRQIELAVLQQQQQQQLRSVLPPVVDRQPLDTDSAPGFGPRIDKPPLVPIRGESINFVGEEAEEDYNDYSNSFEQDSHRFDKSTLSVASSYGPTASSNRPPVKSAPVSTVRLNTSHAAKSILEESSVEEIEEISEENEVASEINHSRGDASVQSSSFGPVTTRGRAGVAARAAARAANAAATAHDISSHSIRTVDESQNYSGFDKSFERSIAEESYSEQSFAAKWPPISGRGPLTGQHAVVLSGSKSTLGKKAPVSKYSEHDYSEDGFEIVEEEAGDESYSDAEADIAEEIPSHLEEQDYEIVEEDGANDYSQVFDQSRISQNASISAVSSRHEQSKFMPQTAVSLDTSAFKPAKREPSTATSAPVSTRLAASLDLNFKSESDFEEIRRQIVSEYKVEMEKRLKSQEKLLAIRVKALKAKKEHELSSLESTVQSAKHKIPPRIVEEQRQKIENDYEEAMAAVEKDGWELKGRSFRELRRFNRLESDFARYQDSLVAGQHSRDSTSLTIRDIKVKSPVKVPHVSAAPQLLERKIISNSSVADADDSVSESYESSFDSPDTQSQSINESTSGPIGDFVRKSEKVASLTRGIAFSPQRQNHAPENTSERAEYSIEEVEEDEDVEEIAEEEAEISYGQQSNEYSTSKSGAVESHSRSRSAMRTPLAPSANQESYSEDNYDGEDNFEQEIEEDEPSDKDDYSQVFDSSAVSALSKSRSSPARKANMSAGSIEASNKGLQQPSKQFQLVDEPIIEESSSSRIGQSSEHHADSGSADTVEALDSSIDEHKLRIANLKAQLEQQQAERERLEILRQKAAEKKLLVEMEIALKKELEEEAARIRAEKNRILGLEEFIGAAEKSNDVTGDQNGSGTTNKPVSQFSDREKMAEWVEVIKEPLEDEESVVEAENDVDDDSWASGHHEFIGLPTGRSAGPNRTSNEAVGVTPDYVQEGLLYQGVVQHQAAVRLQAQARGMLARESVKEDKAATSWAREQLKKEAEHEEASGMVEFEGVVEQLEDMAMDDSFASGDEYLSQSGRQHSASGSPLFKSTSDFSRSSAEKKIRMVEDESFVMEESDDDDEFEHENDVQLIKQQLLEAELLQDKLSELQAAKERREIVDTEVKSSPKREFVPLPSFEVPTDGMDVTGLGEDRSVHSEVQESFVSEAQGDDEDDAVLIDELEPTVSSSLTVVDEYRDHPPENSTVLVTDAQQFGNVPVRAESDDEVSVYGEDFDTVDEDVQEIEEVSAASAPLFNYIGSSPERDQLDSSTRSLESSQKSDVIKKMSSTSAGRKIAMALESSLDFDAQPTGDAPSTSSSDNSHDDDSIEEVPELEESVAYSDTHEYETSSGPNDKLDNVATVDIIQPASAVEDDNLNMTSYSEAFDDVSNAIEPPTDLSSREKQFPPTEHPSRPHLNDSVDDDGEIEEEISIAGSVASEEHGNQEQPELEPNGVPQEASIEGSLELSMAEGSASFMNDTNNVNKITTNSAVADSHDSSPHIVDSNDSSARLSPAPDRDTSLMYSMGSSATESDVFGLKSPHLPQVPETDSNQQTSIVEVLDRSDPCESENEGSIHEEYEEALVSDLDVSGVYTEQSDVISNSLAIQGEAGGDAIPALAKLSLNVSFDAENDQLLQIDLPTGLSERQFSDISFSDATPHTGRDALNDSDLDTVAWANRENVTDAPISGVNPEGVSSILTFTPERATNREDYSDSNVEDIVLEMPSSFPLGVGFKKANTGGKYQSLFTENSLDISTEDQAMNAEDSESANELSAYADSAVPDRMTIDSLIPVFKSESELMAYTEDVTEKLFQRILKEAVVSKVLLAPTPEESAENRLVVDNLTVEISNVDPGDFIPSLVIAEAADAAEESFSSAFDSDSEDSEAGDRSPDSKIQPISDEQKDEPPAPMEKPSSFPSLLGNMPPLGGRSTISTSSFADVSAFDEDELNNLYDFDPSTVTVPSPTVSKSLVTSGKPGIAKDTAKAAVTDEQPATNGFSPVPFSAVMIECAHSILSSANLASVLASFKNSEDGLQLIPSNILAKKQSEDKKDDCSSNDLVALERINDILSELFTYRNAKSISQLGVSLPKRLLAQSMELTEDGLRAAVQRQLQEDLTHAVDVTAGRQHVLELVNVRVLDGVPEQVVARLREVSAFVADTILSRCLVDLTNEILSSA